ncbi:MAG: ATP-binding protein [Coriobacteriia bacterium]|nr:ATP-binding protein [Coriobacteriia bacterium]
MSNPQSGPGIAEQDLERIFNEFERLDAARVSVESGTGLGLSLARRLAREHCGDVTVSSQLGQGSTFTARFAACA